MNKRLVFLCSRRGGAARAPGGGGSSRWPEGGKNSGGSGAREASQEELDELFRRECVLGAVSAAERQRLYECVLQYDEGRLRQVWERAERRIAELDTARTSAGPGALAEAARLDLALLARISSQADFSLSAAAAAGAEMLVSRWAKELPGGPAGPAAADAVDSLAVLVVNGAVELDAEAVAALALESGSSHALGMLGAAVQRSGDVDLAARRLCARWGSVGAVYPRTPAEARDLAWLAAAVCEALDCRTVRHGAVLSCLAAALLGYLASERIGPAEQLGILEPLADQLWAASPQAEALAYCMVHHGVFAVCSSLFLGAVGPDSGSAGAELVDCLVAVLRSVLGLVLYGPDQDAEEEAALRLSGSFSAAESEREAFRATIC